MPLKPGYFTTEFWFAIFANLVAFLDYAHVWNAMPFQYAAAVQTIVTAAYALSRGWAKNGVTIPPVVADIERALEPGFNPQGAVAPPPSASSGGGELKVS